MELTPLKYFIKLAEKLSFTEAAKSLFITQSTLSLSIKQLEEELGIALFDRIGKKIYLTEAGSSFLLYAQKSIDIIENGIQELHERKHIYIGKIRIGVIYSLYPILNDCVLHFSRIYPKVQLVIEYSHSIYELADKVSNNELDFALSYRPNKISPLLDVCEFSSYPLCVIAHTKHPVVVRKSFSLEDIVQYPLIFFPQSFYTRQIVDKMLLQKKIKIIPQIEVNSTPLLLEMLKTGEWISILSQDITHKSIDLKAIPIKGIKERMHASLLFPKGKQHSSITILFLDMLKEIRMKAVNNDNLELI